MMIVYCPRPFNQGYKQGEDFCIKSRIFREFIRKSKLWKSSWYKCTVESISRNQWAPALLGKLNNPNQPTRPNYPRLQVKSSMLTKNLKGVPILNKKMWRNKNKKQLLTPMAFLLSTCLLYCLNKASNIQLKKRDHRYFGLFLDSQENQPQQRLNRLESGYFFSVFLWIKGVRLGSGAQQNYRIYIMEEWKRDNLTNREVNVVQRYWSRIKEIQDQATCSRIVNRDTNNLNFYKITPKDELPIFLQKMRFQTLHLKEKDITESIKVFKKENQKPAETKLRKKIRESGQLMLLSEIYQNLGQSGNIHKSNTSHSLIYHPEQPNELDEWEKQHKGTRVEGTQLKLVRDSKDSEKNSLRGLKQGCDFKGEIERGLQIIQVTHGSEANLLNRYLLIENSSKLLKKDLEQKKIQIEENIKTRMKLLYEARTEYHFCFQEKNRLYMEQKLLREQPKQDILRLSHKSLSSKAEKNQKKSLIEANDSRIARTKKTIEGLEDAISHLEEELKKIMLAENLYFKLTLKNGADVRESGLVWVIQKLQMKESDITHYEFPSYLDKKSKLFLILKAENEEQKEILLEEKRKFVNEIGRTTSEGKFKYSSLINAAKTSGPDKIVEAEYRVDSNIPKKYRKSQRKLSAMAEEFIKDKSLMDLRGAYNREVQISADLEGMTNKEIYNRVGQRIKKLDLSKIKREKLGAKGARLMDYQSLLEKIKNAHIRLQQMDFQHQNYLLGHYRDNRNLFFMQAAACFGYKRAYSMIIKHYSWKNYNDPQLHKQTQ